MPTIEGKQAGVWIDIYVKKVGFRLFLTPSIGLQNKARVEKVG